MNDSFIDAKDINEFTSQPNESSIFKSVEDKRDKLSNNSNEAQTEIKEYPYR